MNAPGQPINGIFLSIEQYNQHIAILNEIPHKFAQSPIQHITGIAQAQVAAANEAAQAVQAAQAQEVAKDEDGHPVETEQASIERKVPRAAHDNGGPGGYAEDGVYDPNLNNGSAN